MKNKHFLASTTLAITATLAHADDAPKYAADVPENVLTSDLVAGINGRSP